MAADGRGLVRSAPVRWALFLALTLGLANFAKASSDSEVRSALEARGLSEAALGIPWNIIQNDPFTPPTMPRAVRRGLPDPLLVPELAETACAVADNVSSPDTELAAGTWVPPVPLPETLRSRLAWFVTEVAFLAGDLEAEIDFALARSAAAELSGADSRWRAASRLAEQINAGSVDAIAKRFMRAVGKMGASFDAGGFGPARFASPIGDIVIGSTGEDAYPSDAAMIIDPGGNDVYRRRPTVGGVSIVFDAGGDDRYVGDDVTIAGLSAIVDLDGDDRYEALASGLAATVGGAALIDDRSGDDRYEAGVFGEGAAIAGVAGLVDRNGADRYRVRARGQGFAGPGGRACLWDGQGDDLYEAAGLPDPYNRRGAMVSQAQGAAIGDRRVSAGGVGVLRDDAGDDRYEAAMFAQGAGYYFGFGVLIEGGGNDSYDAARYAQGQGTHGGIGYLGDRGGDDAYMLAVGVGQGMGLDTGVGILRDEWGNDGYEAPNIAQGATTGNGFGLLVDGGGGDRYRLFPPGDGWGRGRPDRGLPGLALLLDRGGEGRASLGSSPFADTILPGGPMAGRDAELGPAPEHVCPATAASPSDPEGPALALLRQSAPVFGTGPRAIAAYATLVSGFPGNLAGLVAAVPPEDVGAIASLRNVVRCALVQADPAGKAAAAAAVLGMLKADPLSWKASLLLTIAGYAEADLPIALIETIAGQHPDCAARAAALRFATGDGETGRSSVLIARSAASLCWQERAAAARFAHSKPSEPWAVPPEKDPSGGPDGLPALDELNDDDRR